MSEQRTWPAIDPVYQRSLSMDGRLEFPFPLSDGTVAELRLPPTLSAGDARRLGEFIMALAAASSGDTETAT